MGIFDLSTAFQLDIVSDQVAPPFLQGPNGSKYLTVIGKEIDLIRFRSAAAIANRFPLIADPSALYYHGLDRLLTQGPGEANTIFAGRLSRYLDDWRIAGSNWSLLREVLSQIAPLISPLPPSWIVNDYGYWSYYKSAGDVTKPPFATVALNNWNWDQTAISSYWQSYWRDFIGVSNASTWAPQWATLGDGGLPALGDATASLGSLGFQNLTPAFWQTLRGTVQTFHRAGSWVEYLLAIYGGGDIPDGRPGFENPNGVLGIGYKIANGAGPQKLYQSSWLPADNLPVPMMPFTPPPGIGNNQPDRGAGFKIVGGQYLPA
jgi:hypothetical protein